MISRKHSIALAGWLLPKARLIFLPFIVMLMVTCGPTDLEVVSPTPTSPPASGEQLIVESSGGIVEKWTLEDLVLRADTILIGTVGEMQSAWNHNHTSIHTDVTIVPDQWIKGKTVAGPSVVRVPGGEVQGAAQDVSTAPSFQQGEKVIIFLQQGEDAQFHVTGGFQGKFIVENNRVLGEEEVPLADFLDRIQAILKGQP
jgi:hypothetical protein